MNALRIAPLLAIALMALEKEAEAGVKNICFRIPVTLDDNDNSTDDIGHDGNWKARGMRMKIWRRSTEVVYFDSFADAEGCASINTNSTDLWVEIRTYGELTDDNKLWVHPTGFPVGYSFFTKSVDLDPVDGLHYIYWGSESNRTRVYLVAAYMIQNGFRGGNSGGRFHFHLGNDMCCSNGNGCCGSSTGSSCSCTVDGERVVDLKGSGDSRKYVMGHEYGHASLRQWTGSYSNDCSLGGSSHGMTSLEYASCAAMEGWAHFVALDLWNDHEDGTNPDGFFRYWGPSTWIDAEFGESGYEQDYLETQYGAQAGRGVELDWMRAWWDYHTNSGEGGASGAVNHTVLLNELETANLSSQTNTFENVRAGIQTESGASQANDRWEALGITNGIAH